MTPKQTALVNELTELEVKLGQAEKERDEAQAELAAVTRAADDEKLGELVWPHDTLDGNVRRAAILLRTTVPPGNPQCPECKHSMVIVWAHLNEPARGTACPRCLQNKLAEAQAETAVLAHFLSEKLRTATDCNLGVVLEAQDEMRNLLATTSPAAKQMAKIVEAAEEHAREVEKLGEHPYRIGSAVSITLCTMLRAVREKGETAEAVEERHRLSPDRTTVTEGEIQYTPCDCDICKAVREKGETKPQHTPHHLELRERGSAKVIKSRDVTGIPVSDFAAIEEKLLRGRDPERYHVMDRIAFPIECPLCKRETDA